MTKKKPTAASGSSSAFVFSTKPTRCPACGIMIPASTVHRCGDLTHDETAPIEAFAAAFLGAKGGSVKSQAKTEAARKNATGRPKGAKDLKPRKKRGTKKRGAKNG